ncbi:MAG: ABC transporter permease [Tannerellaceae bacterium]|jgi:ABC-2 type transport system permease protein|nr:ABC transporter permease [Tannerellaceae bacterium]
MEKDSRLLSIIKEGTEDTFAVWKEELKNVFRDGGVVIFFFLVPLCYPLLYAFIYDNEIVREAKLAVVDQSATYLSREFIRRIDATPDVQVIGVYTDLEEARRRMDQKDAYGILLFPSEFSREVHTGRQTRLSLYCDMSSLLYYKAFLLSATEVSLDIGKEFMKRNEPAAFTEASQEILVNPVHYEQVMMFNTQGGFASFLVPAILILIIHQTLLLGICMLGGTAGEKRRLRDPSPPLSFRPYSGTLRIVLGKSLAYLLLYTVVCLWVLAVVPRLFSLPQAGDPGDVLLFILPYLSACIFFAMTLSGFMTSRESPFLLLVFTSVILLFLSGISWPVEAMPPFWRALSYVFPSTPGIQGFVRIHTMGASLSEVAFEYRLLWIQAGVYFILACLNYRYRLIHYRPDAFPSSAQR